MIDAKKVQKLSDIEILAKLPVKADLTLLKDRFAGYRYPTKKISDLVQKEFLFPLQRASYLNLKSEELKALSLESVANGLLFPSYVSAEWALQFYGLMTDRVHTITSVTPLRPKTFKTPLGNFSFEHLKKDRYPLGYKEATSQGKSFFLARPEKALVDYINLRVGEVSWRSAEDIAEFFEDDLRIHVEKLLDLIRTEDVQEILPGYHRNSKEARALKWLLAQKEIRRG
jgi:hypothetical protein